MAHEDEEMTGTIYSLSQQLAERCRKKKGGENYG
jgi:hypothetical protein